MLTGRIRSYFLTCCISITVLYEHFQQAGGGLQHQGDLGLRVWQCFWKQWDSRNRTEMLSFGPDESSFYPPLSPPDKTTSSTPIMQAWMLLFPPPFASTLFHLWQVQLPRLSGGTSMPEQLRLCRPQSDARSRGRWPRRRRSSRWRWSARTEAPGRSSETWRNRHLLIYERHSCYD